MKIPITQSKDWYKLQQDFGERSLIETGDGYHYLAIVKHTPAGNYLYCPYGPCYDNQTSFMNALSSLRKHAKDHHVIFVRVEPQDPDFYKYAPNNAKKTTDLNPKETWVLPLEGSDEELKARLPSRLLRYYKSAPNKGITITKTHNPEEIKQLVTLQSALAKEKGISIYPESYLKTELKQSFATLYLVDYTNPENKSKETVAAGLVFDDKTTRYNIQGAQSDQGKKLHATGILTIQLILDAKSKQLKSFDFWGIAPEGSSPNHPWAGFTSFKKTFQGYEKDYAGTYDIVLNPTKYKIYQLTRRLNRILRKIK